MRQFRRGAGLLIAMTMTMSLVAMIWQATPANAAGHIIIEWAQQTSDPYVLQIDANDSNGLPLTSLTVHLWSGSTDVYDITDMMLSSHNNDWSQQIWTAAAPIPQADIPPGTYTMTADASDAQETDQGLPAYGFGILYTPTITVTASPGTLSYDDTSTTISGTVTGVVAGSPYPTPVALAGVSIDLYDTSTRATTPIAITQADGSFSAQVQLPTAGAFDQIYAESGPTWYQGIVGLPLSWAMDATRLVSVEVSPQDFIYGGAVQATMTGTAEYDNASTGWQPLTDYAVSVGILGTGTSATVTTNSSGQFTWTYLPSSVTAWYATVGDGNVLAYSGASGDIHIAVPLRFTSFTASLSPLAELTANACIAATVPGFTGPTGSLEIQYSAGKTGPWKTLGLLAPRLSPGCPSSQSDFGGTLHVRLARAYYRAYVPATPDNEAATSTPVLQWKYVTRIIALRVSPRSVRRGGELTVSGRLQTYNGRWKSYRHQRVLIVLKPKGSKVWYWIVKALTNSSGHFTSTFRDPVSADWSAVFEGNATHFASGGAVYYVRIRARPAAQQHITLTWHPMTPLRASPLLPGDKAG